MVVDAVATAPTMAHCGIARHCAALRGSSLKPTDPWFGGWLHGHWFRCGDAASLMVDALVHPTDRKISPTTHTMERGGDGLKERCAREVQHDLLPTGGCVCTEAFDLPCRLMRCWLAVSYALSETINGLLCVTPTHAPIH